MTPEDPNAPAPSDSPLEVAAPPGGNQLNKVVASLVATFFLFCFGAILGGFLATRIFQPDHTGWDQLSDLFGGFLVGGLLSFPVSLYLILKTHPRVLYIAAALAAAGTLLVYFLGRASG